MKQHFKQISFGQLAGWNKDDHCAAMNAFLNTARHMVEAPYHTRALNVSSEYLVKIAKQAIENAPFDQNSARQFFEEHFSPFEIKDQENNQLAKEGFVTAYFEPEVLASRTRTADFSAPLYRRPDNLVDVNGDNRPDSWDPEFKFARIKDQDEEPGLEVYPDRKAINNGYLDGKGLEIAYVKDLAEALYVHIQGSARLRFADEAIIRVGFAAKTGHPYTAVGKVLLDQGELSRDNCGMRAIRNWFSANPDKMHSIIEKNRSYIFFNEYPVLDVESGPVGAAKVPLVAERSLAIDRTLHTFGTPIWIETDNPLPGESSTFKKLMIAQDTGSAIIGPTRGDLFLGSGDGPGKIAGDTRHQARFVVLLPKQQLRN